MYKNHGQTFLEKYRVADSLIIQAAAVKGLSFKGLVDAEEYCEKAGNEEDKQKLRMLRMIRNFIVHTPGGAEFLASEAAQLEYLDRVRDECLSFLDTVQKHMLITAAATCRTSAKFTDVAAQMIRRRLPFVGVISDVKCPLCVLDFYTVSEAALSSKTMVVQKLLAPSGKKPKSGSFACVKKDILFAEAPKADLVFVTKDGTAETAVIGVLDRR